METEIQIGLLKDRFSGELLGHKTQWGELTVSLPAKALLGMSTFLRDTPGLEFDFLSDVTAVDWGLEAEPRFEVVYHLYSIKHRHRIRMKVPVAEGTGVPTVSKIWKTANWHERETYDMFGIRFDNHPDLRRILMPDDYEGHPLRKDFPLRGYRG